ncbi:MAG: SAM-dependent methyltransferase [Caulobacteraceae bacterium]
MKHSKFAVTASADYLNQGLNELQELDRSLKTAALFESGVAIIESELDKEAFISMIKKGGTIFIRHIHPVDYTEAVDREDFQEVISALKGYEGQIGHGEKVAVQIRKGKGDYSFSTADIKNRIDRILTEEFGAEPEVKKPGKIISILLDGGKCHIGLSTPEDNLSSWSGGMVHYRKSDDDISRAKYKLMEAIEVFDIDMSRFGNALDLGAAPGGWSSVLLDYGIKVTAVDTGDMDKRLYEYPGFRFIKTNVSDMDLGGEIFDIMTSDVSWNPKNTARMINAAAAHLKDGGTAVVTLKLMGEKARKAIKEVTGIYREIFDIIKVKQLFHNRDEVTLYLYKR